MAVEIWYKGMMTAAKPVSIRSPANWRLSAKNRSDPIDKSLPFFLLFKREELALVGGIFTRFQVALTAMHPFERERNRVSPHGPSSKQ